MPSGFRLEAPPRPSRPGRGFGPPVAGPRQNRANFSDLQASGQAPHRRQGQFLAHSRVAAYRDNPLRWVQAGDHTGAPISSVACSGAETNEIVEPQQPSRIPKALHPCSRVYGAVLRAAFQVDFFNWCTLGDGNFMQLITLALPAQEDCLSGSSAYVLHPLRPSSEHREQVPLRIYASDDHWKGE